MTNGGINLNTRKRQPECMEGRLPSIAPLANPFVPFQFENPPRYDLPKGFIRGTLFPGLDLPFMGMVNNREKKMSPLTELQTLAFAIQELALYLDTHRDDCEALELYRYYQALYKKGEERYVTKYGPISHRSQSEGPYSWLDDPWPWEYCRNREG